jgi:hypothetical protein
LRRQDQLADRAAVRQPVLCCGEQHVIHISKSGRFSSPQHTGDRVRAFDVVEQLQGRVSPCMTVLRFLQGELPTEEAMRFPGLTSEFLSLLGRVTASRVVRHPPVERPGPYTRFVHFLHDDLTFHLRGLPPDVLAGPVPRAEGRLWSLLKTGDVKVYFDQRRRLLGTRAFSHAHTISKLAITDSTVVTWLPLLCTKIVALVERAEPQPRLRIFLKGMR